MEEVSSLAPRLSKRTFSLFSDPRQPLFDSDLLGFSFGDLLHYMPGRNRRKALETAVEATFRSFDQKTLHLLSYKGIEALSVNVPSERWFEMKRKSIDHLLADELTSAGANRMQHAFLFASGAVISITFERVRWETKRNT